MNLKAQGLLNAAAHIRERYGEEALAAILASCRPAVRERIEAGIAINWHPLEEMTDFLVAAHAHLRKPGLGEEVGAAGARANTRGVLLRTAMLLSRPENVLRRASTLWHQYNDTGELSLRSSGPHAVEIEITGLPRAPRIFCDTITGWARELVTSAGGKSATARHVECRCYGDPRCVWEARWSGILGRE